VRNHDDDIKVAGQLAHVVRVDSPLHMLMCDAFGSEWVLCGVGFVLLFENVMTLAALTTARCGYMSSLVYSAVLPTWCES
jgi:hypothetical protein